MAHQMVFKRYELKYLISFTQKETLLQKIAPYMEADPYGNSTIRNIYFDTDDYRLIRRSIEKPCYKEKIRIRSYALAKGEDTVFVELKKKYEKIVYKRRIAPPYDMAMAWICGESDKPCDTQIAREIDAFLHFYPPLHPSVFLSYEREAYYGKEDKNFRVTFDHNISARTQNVSLSGELYGRPLLMENCCLMELKCAGGMPLFMAQLLSQEKIYKTSFSKYGTAYQREIFPVFMIK
ncbi:MAG: polyphosphate polymerase domain-containing protein [Clostridia bacterium]|nr:polyphosphate polymerase domain-containing protein [Clostridia bacterium]